MVIVEVEGQGLEVKAGIESGLFFYIIGQGKVKGKLDIASEMQATDRKGFLWNGLLPTVFKEIDKREFRRNDSKGRVFSSGLSTWQELEVRIGCTHWSSVGDHILISLTFSCMNLNMYPMQTISLRYKSFQSWHCVYLMVFSEENQSQPRIMDLLSLKANYLFTQ